ncbi:MAG: PTS glucose transporter subunit IIA [Lachnospiraceae bacterium]|nr:PTS glucose transporter subunit IIA [Lachnospiraceae bacterium]
MAGFFEKLLGKDNGIQVFVPVEGDVIKASEINDPTFSEEMIGKTVGIKPSSGTVYAPFDAEVLVAFDTKHAVALKSDDGIELMIHFGLDTVKMNGEPFEMLVKVGDKIKKGDVIMRADLEKIKAAGFDTVVPVVVTNPDEFKSIEFITGSGVKSTDILAKIKK